MYAVRVDGKKDTKKGEKIKNNIVARTMTFDDYMRCLNEEIEMTRHQSCIRSKTRGIHNIRIENRSESIRQMIRYIGLDGDVTVGALANTFVIYVTIMYYLL